MYCIRCECLPVQKKRRIVAKVQCRNIKHECPKPTCDEPVLLPGRCCKLCPSDLSGKFLLSAVGREEFSTTFTANGRMLSLADGALHTFIFRANPILVMRRYPFADQLSLPFYGPLYALIESPVLRVRACLKKTSSLTSPWLAVATGHRLASTCGVVPRRPVPQ